VKSYCDRDTALEPFKECFPSVQPTDKQRG